MYIYDEMFDFFDVRKSKDGVQFLVWVYILYNTH